MIPTTRRSRELTAAPEDVWRLVCDPYHLPRWWPRVERVEGVAGDRFTELLRAAKSGRAVRADFRVVQREHGRLLRFEQELAGSPFERVLSAAATEIAVEPSPAGTRVTVAVEQRLRGLSRLGGFMVRRATGRILDEALDGLELAVG